MSIPICTSPIMLLRYFKRKYGKVWLHSQVIFRQRRKDGEMGKLESSIPTGFAW